MRANRRGFLKAALGGVVGLCLPLPAYPRAKPSPTPFSSIFTPGTWAGITKDDFAFGEVEALDLPPMPKDVHNHLLHIKAHVGILQGKHYIHTEIWKDLIGED